MKNMKKFAIFFIFLIFLGLTGGVMASVIQVRASTPGQTETPFIAPFCSAYTEWLHKHSVIYTRNGQGHGLGLIPAPVDLAGASSVGPWATGSEIPDPMALVPEMSTAAGQITGETRGSTGTSARYDLRNLGKLMPVRDQGQDGNCWAFAATASLESSLLPGEAEEFSEDNMKNLHGFDVLPNTGGNDFMASAYLARWAGPVLAAQDPYSDGSTTSPSNLPVKKHVQDIIFIPARSGPLENDQIKSIIMQYGAVYSTFRWEDPSYNSQTASYYYPGTGGPNHAIVVTGWDDNYDRNSFSSPAPGNGAFIAQNSWGSTWGDGGYFYISYYDTRIGRDNAMFTAEAPDTYSRIYQYDPLGWVANFGMGSDTAYYANVFTTAGNEQLKAVSFYTTATYADYEVKVFVDPDQGPVSSKGHSAAQTGMIDLPGYHTITLDTPVKLRAGQKFSVAVKVRSPGWNFPVAIEYPISGYTSGAVASAGQSYVSSDGNSWRDLTLSQPNTNVCLKAFTITTAATSKTPATSFPSPVFTKGTGTTSADILKKLTGNLNVGIKGTSTIPVLKMDAGYPVNVTLPVIRNNMGATATETGIHSTYTAYSTHIPPAEGIRNMSRATPLV
jgi:C1A family cysteine protease